MRAHLPVADPLCEDHHRIRHRLAVDLLRARGRARVRVRARGRVRVRVRVRARVRVRVRVRVRARARARVGVGGAAVPLDGLGGVGDPRRVRL